MKDLTKIYIDLSKLSEEQINKIYSVIKNDNIDSFTRSRLRSGHTFKSYFLINEGDWVLTQLDYKISRRKELTYPEFIKLFEGADRENETSLQIAIKALENIINPIGYMKSQLEEGDTLNGGYAIMLSEKPHFYQDIAKEALRKINSNQ